MYLNYTLLFWIATVAVGITIYKQVKNKTAPKKTRFITSFAYSIYSYLIVGILTLVRIFDPFLQEKLKPIPFDGSALLKPITDLIGWIALGIGLAIEAVPWVTPYLWLAGILIILSGSGFILQIILRYLKLEKKPSSKEYNVAHTVEENKE